MSFGAETVLELLLLLKFQLSCLKPAFQLLISPDRSSEARGKLDNLRFLEKTLFTKIDSNPEQMLAEDAPDQV